MRQAPRSPLSFKLQRVANVPERPPPSTRLMSCAHIANRRLSRIIGAKWWSEWQDLNLRPPRPERGALPDCATLRLKARLITRVGKWPQARSRSKDMTAQPATPVLKIEPQAIVPDAAAAVERAARTLAAGGL